MKKENYLKWEAAVPMVTNRFLLYDYLTFLGLYCLLFSIVVTVALVAFSWYSGSNFGWDDTLGTFKSTSHLSAGFMLIYYVLAQAAAFFFLKNRMYVRTIINDAGVSYETKRGSTMDAPDEATTMKKWLSFQSWHYPENQMDHWGKPKWVEWHKISEAIFHPKDRVITLSSGFLPVVRLYCPTEAHYLQARELVLQHVKKGRG